MTTRTSMATVEFRDVRFAYGAMPILDGASLELEAGTFSVLAGSNGSGKSTLLKLCLGLLQPDEGTVEVFGAPPHDAAARRRIGYAPQGLRMATTLPVSVTEVVAAGLAPTRGWFGRLDKTGWTQVERAIDSVGLGDLSRECMFELSGGQQQRAILARALVGEPDLLLLDEPTTGIDQRFRPALAKELRRRADAGATIVAVSHDPDDFHSVSDRILVLVDGRLQQVSHEEFHTHLDWGGRGAGGDR